MSDDPRTEDQLRAEIAALKKQLHERRAGAGKRSTKAASLRPSPVTRRASFAMWLSPVILLAPAVNTAQRMARALSRRFKAS